MPIKVSDLAKELGVSCENVLEQLSRLYVDAEDENSKIDDKIAALVRIKLGGIKATEPVPKKAKKAKPKVEAAPSKPKASGQAVKPVLEKKEEEVREEKQPQTLTSVKAKEEPLVKEVEAPLEPAVKEKTEKVEPKKEVKEPIKKPVIEVVEKVDKSKTITKRPKEKVKKEPVIEIVEKGLKPKVRSKQFFRQERFKPAGVESISLEPKKAALRKIPQKIEMHLPVSIRIMAPRINIKPNAIIQYLMAKGILVNINQDLDEAITRDIMTHFGYELELPETLESIEKELVKEEEHPLKATLEPRAPVVTFMGHVDHGKTSLLDYIRNTMVAKGEKGGITQHIGAYKVKTAKGSVTFLDTPGHAAFTAMRARGANATDVVVLVVAADDGVMPQTKEAIDHAKAAGVPIVVAINKCDLPNAGPDRVRRELQTEGLAPEDWGGKTIMVEVSARTGEGVDKLVEMLMLESEMLELKANPHLRARGVVIESKKTPDQGVVVTLLVQNGTLRLGDIVLCGAYYGKIKAMLDDVGQRVNEAPPATPVEILGLQGIPEAGEEFFIVKDEKKAKTLSTLKQSEKRIKNITGRQVVSLEDLHRRIVEGAMKELKMILKADVQGSVEALKQSLEELATSEVKLSIIHSAIGNINESDVMLAMVSDAIVIGFNVKVDQQAEELAKDKGVDIHTYDIIYEAIADVKAGLEGLLEPELKEVFQGRAEVLEVFSASKVGRAAGCMVTKGAIHRKDRIRLKRKQEVVYEGEINSLKRFKDDVKDVKEGLECGISFKNFNDIHKGDILEAYIIEKVARRLEK